MAKQANIPERIGRYEVLGPLAAGGMAEILLARLAGPHGFERVVVLKRVLPHLARDDSFVRMFIDEARIVSELRHPNVVQVIELGQADGELFMAMEYLEGEPLSGLIRRMRVRGTGLPPALAAYVIAEAAAGLHAAHELKSSDGRPRDLVHRDVSPQNVFVTYDGQVKVIDFGIAKAADRVTRTQTGQLKGKQAYMSPEQTRLGPLDRRSDVFSLGVVLWETTVGQRLFDKGALLDTLQAIRACEVPPPSRVISSYPRGLERIVMHALAKEPEARPASALDLRSELLDEARALGLAPDPKAALGKFMREHFEDRIAHKTAVLRSVRDGVHVEAIPAAEVDLSAELSPANSHIRATENIRLGHRESGAPSAPALSAGDPTTAPPGGAVWLKLGVGLLVTVAALAALFWVFPSEPDAPATPPIEAVATPAPAPERDEPPPLRESPTVTLDIVTTPEGAELLVDGEVRGSTPVTIELPRGSGDAAIELRRDGYVSAMETIDTERDVRLRLALRRTPRRPAKRRHGTMMRRSPMSESAPAPPPFGRLD